MCPVRPARPGSLITMHPITSRSHHARRDRATHPRSHLCLSRVRVYATFRAQLLRTVMGFLYLFVVVIAITATAVIAKLAVLRKITPLDLATSLFSISTLLGLLFVVPRLPMKVTGEALLISFIAGLGGAGAVLAFNAAVRAGHFGFSNAIYRSSFLVPVVYSILFLNATIKPTTILGILLILGGIFLISQSTASFVPGKKAELRWFVLIMTAFLLSGIPRVGQTLTSLLKIECFLYLFLSYLGGALTLLIPVLAKRSFNPAALTWGTGAAIASYAGVFCTLKALEHLTPQVVFPISLSAPILLGVFLSLVLFREKVRVTGWIGIALGVSGITVLAIWR
ncbi:MAG TPA: EamA family transporter [Clostridia bacterium]|nr:EamA family transporter [Clostridia bacterium]